MPPVCSLIIKSGLKVTLLYITIELSPLPEHDANLPSFKLIKQRTSSVRVFNI